MHATYIMEPSFKLKDTNCNTTTTIITSTTAATTTAASTSTLNINNVTAGTASASLVATIITNQIGTTGAGTGLTLGLAATTSVSGNNSSNNIIVMGAGGTTAPAMSAHICSSDSFSIIPPPHHELVSANSIELNAAASLSDDSGVPLTTNSSISSGDSYRIGMCKFEIELNESDGEVSQFDSLDNCSEGGMSAENFNTLKKGPLAPIDPPPEFQDSPQTTLVRSISKNIVNSLRRWTSSQSSFEHLKDYGSGNGDFVVSECITPNVIVPTIDTDITLKSNNVLIVDGAQKDEMITQDFYANSERSLKESYAINKHLYSSDSILNSYTDNIYDEPNNIISTSLGNSVDIIESDTSSPLPSPPPPVSIIKIKQTLCPYYQDHTRYFKAIPSEIDNITKAAQRFNTAGLSEIHDYDLYYTAKRNNHQHHHHNHTHNVSNQYDNSLQRRRLYSPLSQHTQYCHYYHQTTTGTTTAMVTCGMNSCGNRPNSRNSLNSRLSSSHNSLNVSSANKPDDSIFITQAMSHDALFTREISDFYNVPIDSDIYAFPVDMIQSEKDMNGIVTTTLTSNVGGGKHMRRAHTDSECIEHISEHISTKYRSQQQTTPQKQQQKGQQQHTNKSQQRRNQRNKRKKRNAGNISNNTTNNTINIIGAGETSDECTGGCGAVIDKSKHRSISGVCGGGGSKSAAIGCGKYRTPHISNSFHSENDTPPMQEPLHMTLDEVKQFYHTLYSDSIAPNVNANLNMITISKSMSTTTSMSQHGVGGSKTKSSSGKIWTISAMTTAPTVPISASASQRSSQFGGSGVGGATTTTTRADKQLSKQQCKHNMDNDKINNNNNNTWFSMPNQHVDIGIGIGIGNGSQQQTTQTVDETNTCSGGSGSNNGTNGTGNIGMHNNSNNSSIHGSGTGSNISNILTNNKQLLHTEKKSQFTLNLKQKFCSIFRFRRNHNRCRSNAATATTATASTTTTGSASVSSMSMPASSCLISGNVLNITQNYGNAATPATASSIAATSVAAAAAANHNQAITTSTAVAIAAATAAAAAASSATTTTTAATITCNQLLSAATTTTSASETETENYLNREQNGSIIVTDDKRKKFQSRALPPLPKKEKSEQKKTSEPRSLQFTSSIEKVKDYGWYWGPLSSEAAEKVLSNEPDGSFIVRDSSDDHYIFSLSFKLNNCVRHVRIEQDQGTFSFGSYAKFKSQTITEFIEKAVEHSRSGRYLFFLHRRPEHGPMRVQLTNPVSRFKHVQSLQHMCRFVILKAVIRKDLIQTLPLPRRLLDYLNYKHCYSEQVESDSSHSQISGDGSM